MLTPLASASLVGTPVGHIVGRSVGNFRLFPSGLTESGVFGVDVDGICPWAPQPACVPAVWPIVGGPLFMGVPILSTV